MGELISVIINVYNGEKFIEKCLDCIINQTYKNLDILIINDGSTDNTLKLCEEYKDNRIRIINQENAGLSLARNVGIENAKGEYLYFIDVDDWIELDTIEYLYNLCKRYNTKMASCKAIEVYEYSNSIKKKKEKVDIISKVEMLKRILLSKDDSVAIWNKLIHKSLFENIRFENRIANDVVVTYKLALEADKVTSSNQVKYYYLKHSNSITYKNNENRAIDLYKATLERYNYVKKLYPNLIENEIGTIYRIMFTYFNENEKVQQFLKEQNSKKLIRKLFSLKIIVTNIRFRDKIKICLFAMCPKIYKIIYKKYHFFNNRIKI